MEDHNLRLAFHLALDEIAPPAPWLTAAVGQELRNRRQGLVDHSLRKAAHIRFAMPWRISRLTAAVVLVALVVLSTVGLLIAITQYAHRAVPATGPPGRIGPMPGIKVTQAGSWWEYSAADAVAWIVVPHMRPEDYPDTFFITHDGGATWRPVRMPWRLEDLSGIDVRWIDSDNLVVVYGSRRIDVTTDGGIHWRAINSSWVSQDGRGRPFFLNAREGWQIGTQALFHTTDGGATWTAVATSFPPGFPFDRFFSTPVFMDSEHGFIHPDGGGQLWVTQDGGRTWSHAALSPPPNWLRGYVPTGPFMFGRNGLIAYRNTDGATLSAFTTADGGLTWSGPQSVPGLTLTALDANHWWVIDDGGRLSRTVDAGASWQRIQAFDGTTLDSVTPVGGDVLWGTIGGFLIHVRTTDGGKHWSRVKLPV